MAKLGQADDLRYYPLFLVVFLGVALAWNQVAKAAAERALLPLLCPDADPAAGPLRVTNNDGTLSNGDKLRGWRNNAYFGTHLGLWTAGCVAAFAALVRAWPAKAPPAGEPGRSAA